MELAGRIGLGGFTARAKKPGKPHICVCPKALHIPSRRWRSLELSRRSLVIKVPFSLATLILITYDMAFPLVMHDAFQSPRTPVLWNHHMKLHQTL
jgi:hypothetical protein